MRRDERVVFGGQGRALALLLGALLIVGYVSGHHADPDDHDDKHYENLQDHKDDDYHKLSDRLDGVTARLKWIDRKLDKRLNPKIRQRALSLEHRLSELEEDHCDKDHYDCGGQDNECVPRLMVCDGRRDCRNGDDEKHCNLPTNTGDRFIGHKVYDNCDQGHVEKVTLIIREVQVRPAYPAFPMVRVVVKSVDDDDEDRIERAYHLVGYYKFSQQNLVLIPPAGVQGHESLGIVLDFDGHDPDKAVGHVVHQVSLHECAKFIFFRDHGHDDDHHDDDHHHGHHGKH